MQILLADRAQGEDDVDPPRDFGRRYDDDRPGEPASVRRAGDEDLDHPDAPRQFLWQGRLYLVRGILDHRAGQIEQWYVVASAGQSGVPMVFSMAFDWSDGAWTVHPILRRDPDQPAAGDSAPEGPLNGMGPER
jgi:hypothetical protein